MVGMDEVKYRLDRYDGLARNLYAAWVAHRMGITLAHARRRYANEVELGAYWMDLARRVENDLLTHMSNALDGPDGETTTIVQ
jgi:hypothetical protein